ncbi:alpha/beta fold hydrolase [Streptomyces muensis]|uniref:alpha/beta fold hydrolase n=1 Tax=Streptomyces muensis TaxID=1077944 RepID=UPI0035573BF6
MKGASTRSGSLPTPAKSKLHCNEAGDGHPLILLHGGGAGASGWSNYSSNIDFFARHYRVFAIDMPGWGKSEPPCRATATTWRRWNRHWTRSNWTGSPSSAIR